ncbi:uncharacterized protein LOC134364520 [Cynocephalus volans]|uniref:uncharacterized protein LOC134364520 n=1 Tax=Cynocephalus volans TaxID=110931 RepID=UPI002FC7D26A
MPPLRGASPRLLGDGRKPFTPLRSNSAPCPAESQLDRPRPLGAPLTTPARPLPSLTTLVAPPHPLCSPSLLGLPEASSATPARPPLPSDSPAFTSPRPGSPSSPVPDDSPRSPLCTLGSPCAPLGATWLLDFIPPPQHPFSTPCAWTVPGLVLPSASRVHRALLRAPWHPLPTATWCPRARPSPSAPLDQQTTPVCRRSTFSAPLPLNSYSAAERPLLPCSL